MSLLTLLVLSVAATSPTVTMQSPVTADKWNHFSLSFPDFEYEVPLGDALTLEVMFVDAENGTPFLDKVDRCFSQDFPHAFYPVYGPPGLDSHAVQLYFDRAIIADTNPYSGVFTVKCLYYIPATTAVNTTRRLKIGVIYPTMSTISIEVGHAQTLTLAPLTFPGTTRWRYTDRLLGHSSSMVTRACLAIDYPLYTDFAIQIRDPGLTLQLYSTTSSYTCAMTFDNGAEATSDSTIMT